MLAFFSAVLVALVMVLPASGADNGTKITGKVIATAADPGGKLAPIVLESKDGVYAIVANPVALKLAKNEGKMMDVTGEVTDAGGKKTITPWNYVPAGAKPGKQVSGA